MDVLGSEAREEGRDERPFLRKSHIKAYYPGSDMLCSHDTGHPTPPW